VDGDEEQRSAAVAVCDGATGDGAEESGDAAPSIVEAEPQAAGSVVADPAEAEPDNAATDDAVADEAVTDDAAFDDTSGESADADADADVVAVAVAVGEEQRGSAPRRLGPYLRRGVVALVAAGVVALAVSAFAWVVPSLDGANRRFIEEAQSHGHAIAPGEQEMLVLSAARKICDRKVTHDTIRERRSTALTSAELAAVGAVFGPRTRDFTALALDTYCSR
jgi:hypothetical protein